MLITPNTIPIFYTPYFKIFLKRHLLSFVLGHQFFDM